MMLMYNGCTVTQSTHTNTRECLTNRLILVVSRKLRNFPQQSQFNPTAHNMVFKVLCKRIHITIFIFYVNISILNAQYYFQIELARTFKTALILRVTSNVWMTVL